MEGNKKIYLDIRPVPGGPVGREKLSIPPSPLSPKRLQRKKGIGCFVLNFVFIFFVFALVIFLMVFPARLNNLKNEIINNSFQGKDYLMSAKDSLVKRDLNGAKIAFATACDKFSWADEIIAQLGQKTSFLDKAYLSSDIAAGIRLIELGKQVSGIGQRSVEILIPLFLQLSESVSGPDLGIDFNFNKAEFLIGEVVGEFNKIKALVSVIDSQRLPFEFSTNFAKLSSQVSSFSNLLKKFKDFLAVMPEIIGEGEYEKNYLILFQNNAELRATGGFIGTYGILRLKKGKVEQIFVDSVYNPDGQLSEVIVPPAPLQRVTEKLAMRDANWFPDFPTSADWIARIYEKEGGITVDGVIAIDPIPVIETLKIIGPIEMKDYGETVTAENFYKIVQYKTGIDYDPAFHPKKFLADFAVLFIERLRAAGSEKFLELANVLAKSFEEKHIQVFSYDKKVQDLFEKLNIAGRVRDTQGDFLMIINSNIGGLKSSLSVFQEVEQEVVFDQEIGLIRKKVIIKRSHQGSYDWPDGTNINQIRIYVPEGSKLIETKGFDKDEAIRRSHDGTFVIYDEALPKAKKDDIVIGHEGGKTVFNAWLVTKPGEKREATIEYFLPFSFAANQDKLYYGALVQKQAGINFDLSRLKIIPPRNYQVVEYSKEGLEGEPIAEVNYKFLLSSDKYFLVIFERK